ncbi:cobalt ECF transporter T component CbiQ [Geomonas sp. Red276]
MASLDGALLDLKRLDRLAAGSTTLHRLDPRVKLLATVVFLVCVVSFGRYELSALVPFLVYPLLLAALGDLPIGYLAHKVLLMCPLALFIGIANPFLDHRVILELGGVGVTGGVISWLSIVLRAVLTVSAALVLVALTGFPDLCRAMERLGMPRAFAMQLLFLYRYLFVLVEEGEKASRSRELRCVGNRGRGISSYASLVGHLLMRTWQKAERIHMAMLARGFTGSFPRPEESSLKAVDLLFLAGCTVAFITFRTTNPTRAIGSLVTGILP